MSFVDGVVMHAAMLYQFGGTAFVHGYLVIGFLYCVLPFYIWVVVLLVYTADMFLSGAERKCKREWRAFRSSFIPQSALDYFNMQLLMAEDVNLKQGDQYLFALHPHGIFPYGGIPFYAPGSPLMRRFPWLRVHPCGATVVFKVPFIREYLLWTGHLDASRSVMQKHMSQGKTLAILPGGEVEALRTENGREAVVLKGRKGFVSLALQHGVALVPTYSFGVNETFHVSKTALFSVRNWLQRVAKVSIPVFWGTAGTPLPRRTQISLAVGKPILVPANPSGEKPSEALVDEYHGKYVAALEALFKQHREAAGYGERELAVLEVPGAKMHKA